MSEQDNALSPVLCLMGPTASGKTALAMQLSQQLDADIISVDSAMVYRGMDIGTAKPTAEELAVAPHQLIDICDPAEAYSAAQFRHDALRCIEQSHQQGRLPVLVGGTMLYFKALIEGLSPLPEADPEVREAIRQQAEQQGWQALHDELANIDPVAAARIHPNDPQRLSRALEVFRVSGKTLTVLTQNQTPQLPYRMLQFAIAPEQRSALHDLIAKRFQIMLEQGFGAEVEALYERGDLNPDMPSMRCVGYRQYWHYLAGGWDYDEMVYRAIVATRQLAKRQFTWLRNWPDITWLTTGHQDNFDKLVAALS